MFDTLRRRAYNWFVNQKVELKHGHSFGFRFRRRMSRIERRIGPGIKKVIPTFIVAHVVYIITMVVLASIWIYPVKTIDYIDALFFAAGACTQAGLNTVDTNDLSLFQQLSIYIFCMLTTPIFIHGSLSALRLYWFEKTFDNIKINSKLRSKMRRTQTLESRRNKNFRTQTNPDVEPGIPDSPDKPPIDTSSNSSVRDHYNQVEHYSEPSDSGDDLERNEHDPSVVVNTTSIQPGVHKDIKFSELPKPTGRKDVQPQDMYMSIAMLQNKQPYTSELSESGPVLHIKGPAERRKHRRRRRYKRKSIPGPRRPSSESAVAPESEEGNRHHQTAQSGPLSITSSTEGNTLNRHHEESPVEKSEKPSIFQGTPVSFDKIIKKNPVAKNFNKLKRRASSTVFSRNNNDTDESEDSYAAMYDEDNNDEDYDDDEEYDQDEDERELASHTTRGMSTNYLSWEPTIGRNSTFIALTDEQKEELGGVEYRATKMLSRVVVCYYVGFHLLAGIMFLAFGCLQSHYSRLFRSQGFAPAWWGFFTSQSVFNDLGITLTYNSFIPFQQNAYVQVVASFFIIIGNTGFPIMLRFIVWVLFKFAQPLSMRKESLGFLLDHPRRCFTLLFPSAATWWLFFVLVILNVFDWLLFVILDFHRSVVDGIPGGYKVLIGIFQSVSTRTAGFAIVDLAHIHPAVQVSYMVMMYISVLPLAISIRRTNVYEEQSLGVYYPPGQMEEDESDAHQNKPGTFIGTHLRKQLSFDLWFLFLGLFIICLADGGRLSSGDPGFTVFHVLFEIVSAYGTVGLSLGYPGTNTSFSAQFSVISKLVIIAMMIRGRHRGLPYSLDRAILLPSEKMKKRDDKQARHAIMRTMTMDNTLSRMSSGHSAATANTRNDTLMQRLKRPSFLISDMKNRIKGSLAQEFPRSMTSQSLEKTHSQSLRRTRTTPVDQTFDLGARSPEKGGAKPSVHDLAPHELQSHNTLSQ
ncbi:Potassium transport system component [Komagataella phaffii CBS 7435]|uniref:Potassium transport protein n=1 Tax=Komagataella phaffii (strain ATCC 76273 / CBS 7435 / CECT 11047 / NRRL Y-11430 / Wegner 21-1) TaxID=981350 RepID=F2QR19_KOMPC|nr:Potassium transport system component [Komagataella phaffii CBS 7435]CCA37847.1 Potassium transport system component [Komagataella phaffii CBS 7435]